MCQVFAHERTPAAAGGSRSSRFGGGSICVRQGVAPSADGSYLKLPEGFVYVPANLSAHGRRATPEIQGHGTDVAPGMQEVRDRDPFRLGEKPGGDRGRPLMGNGSVLLDVSGLQNDRVAVPPASATADSYDSAGLSIAPSLFYQLIIVSPCSVLWRGAPGLPWSFHVCQLQLRKAQVLQRPLDAKPSQWLSFLKPDHSCEASQHFRSVPALVSPLNCGDAKAAPR